MPIYEYECTKCGHQTEVWQRITDQGARLGFTISILSFVASVAIYLLCIPLFGAMGAALGYILSSIVLAWLTMHHMNALIPLRFRDVLGRTNVIRQFLKNRLGGA